MGGIMNYLAHTWMNIQTDTFIVDIRHIRAVSGIQSSWIIQIKLILFALGYEKW